MYASSYESRIDRGKGEEEEEREKREERGHTVASETFFPLRSKARSDLTNSNNPPVDPFPFPVESKEIEADPKSGTKA